MKTNRRRATHATPDALKGLEPFFSGNGVDLTLRVTSRLAAFLTASNPAENVAVAQFATSTSRHLTSGYGRHDTGRRSSRHAAVG
jgi:hypothetical protein